MPLALGTLLAFSITGKTTSWLSESEQCSAASGGLQSGSSLVALSTLLGVNLQL